MIASAISASFHSKTKSTAVTDNTVSAFWKKKINPYPRKNRTPCRSTVARDIS